MYKKWHWEASSNVRSETVFHFDSEALLLLHCIDRNHFRKPNCFYETFFLTTALSNALEANYINTTDTSEYI